ncbi:MAG TPA: C4-dicarboxylate ABC transporter [Pusillimonas sp.]|jgi:TRAP-type C4-dicarboxylate transport system substrate-binding protein|nr:C4-dicarboxylate ABC transporter [Pusillimonas sp.]MBC42881.1 C4-dicarboxylate ABC transporter [Pusillimonas sp.]HBT34445.1 C4-dicarboxylate ABC transporter [Pusillimonas sp.]HCN73079.1 C4-dicarboxylate ABC transporter [Pusillimonas sp.]HCP77071.1 C4-dicarboxylate ABC transporter [Pusillimonas sp.]|tara:strand:- start:39404 stop:40450 length:1047 start_codon:yes stop_codon:yes gene_type:complete
MKNIISRTLLSLLVAGGFATQANAAEKVTLKVAHFLPTATTAHWDMIVPWCEKIKKESDGGLECQIYPAMQLGGTPPQLLTQARDGVADIVWTLPGYTPGRFPISEVFELPFFAPDHQNTSRALWEFAEKHALKTEFAGLKPIGIWVNGPNYFHLRDKEVKTVAGMQGLKIRAASRMSNKFLTDIGANAMGMPLPQAVEGISKGVLDGLMVPWEVVPSVKLDELTKYHAEVKDESGNFMATSTMVYVMNQAKYDSLPDNLKKVIDDNSGAETSAWIASRFQAADVQGRKAAEEAGGVIYEWSQEEVNKLKDASSEVAQQWIDEMNDKGMDGQALYDDARALVEKYNKK